MCADEIFVVLTERVLPETCAAVPDARRVHGAAEAQGISGDDLAGVLDLWLRWDRDGIITPPHVDSRELFEVGQQSVVVQPEQAVSGVIAVDAPVREAGLLIHDRRDDLSVS